MTMEVYNFSILNGLEGEDNKILCHSSHKIILVIINYFFIIKIFFLLKALFILNFNCLTKIKINKII